VDVTITPPSTGLANHQFGGYVTLASEDAATLRVPYSGFEGDYQQLPLLGYVNSDGENVEQEPHLSEIIYDEDGFVAGYDPVEPGHVFSVRDGDYPVIEAFFGHFPQTMRVTVRDERRGHTYLVTEQDYLRRSPGLGQFWPFAWAGTTQAGRSVPSGTYTLEVEVLKTLGDPANPDHWETWRSPDVIIRR
jgi:minor extracellular serine protease Vpr